jgi:hypothetical protein
VDDKKSQGILLIEMWMLPLNVNSGNLPGPEWLIPLAGDLGIYC